jgi:uncharacterized lipoprotein YddW (UPF0748 family)
MRTAVLIVGAAAVLVTGCIQPQKPGAGGRPVQPLPRPRNIQAIWVTRFDYRSEADVVRIIQDCQQLGFNTILFQVRGAGTAYYRSQIEPRAAELGGGDPGFDPLAVACREARRCGVGLHAWINVMPAWRGPRPPTDPEQLYNKHPDWLWYDQSGRRQPLSTFYVSVNPCLPEVRNYLTALCQEIVNRYDVAGLHLDYIRFPNEPPGRADAKADYPRDARTVALFRQATGRQPDRDRAAWDRWRTDQVTALVRDIRQMVRRTQPEVALSAAVGPDPDNHRRAYYQDALRWMDEGLLDFVVPMNYTFDDKEFAARNQIFLAHAGRTAVVPGVTVEQERGRTTNAQVSEHLRRQMSAALQQAHHVGVFAYGYLFDRTGAAADAAVSRDRAERRQVAGAILRRG